MNAVGVQSKGGELVLRLISLVTVLLASSCVHEPVSDPLPGGEGPTIAGCVSNGDVCFESSVLPLFLSSCARSGCHDSKSREEGYILDSYSNIVRKGISPGNANNSKLYRVLFENGEDRMPPDVPMSQAQKDSIAAWINQGAANTTNCDCFCDTTQYTYTAIADPIIDNFCTGCHKPGALGGNIDLSGHASVKLQAANGKLLGSITHASGFAAMPQGGKLSDCQITQIKSWIDAGAPNN